MNARDVIAKTIKRDIGRQFDATPISGSLAEWEDWSAVGKSLDLIDTADSILTALTEAGFAIVPVMPTEKMLEAYYKGDAPLTAPDCYRFLVSAAKDED